MGTAHGPLAERFERHVVRAAGCHLWTGGKIGGKASGYGQAYVGEPGRSRLAHRVAWELAHGPVPAGLCVLHRCDVRACVNPAHLFLGTVQDNSDDMVAKGRHVKAAPWKLGHPKLGVDAVRAIRESRLSNQTLAVVHGVTVETVWQIRRRKTWRWLL